jgi:hypothetical protein
VRGIPGRMAVSAKGVPGLYSGIRTTKDGSRQYVRVNTAVGWRTKRVSSGTIAIRPRKRAFMYLTSDDVRGMNRLVQNYVKAGMK